MAKRITITLTAQQAMGAENTLLFGVDDGYNWVEGPDGKRHPSKRTETIYTVAMLNNACAPLRVRTPEAQPVVSAEDVAAACLTGQPLRVRFEGFKAEAYQGKNGLGISATADKCVVVAPTSGPSKPT